MSEFASDVREILNFSTAQPGWRAFFVEDSVDKTDYVAPLLGWALVRITTRDNDTGDVLPRTRTRIEGAAVQGHEVFTVFESGAFSGTFERYLSPDEPDPDPGTGRKGKDDTSRSRKV
jgi:hypothetical protein